MSIRAIKLSEREEVMNINEIQNSVGLWICAAIMVLVIVVQAVIYLVVSKKEATKLGISKDKQKQAMRSAAVTCIGPSLALCIMLMTLMASLGAPTAWMRLNDVGSGRSELAIAGMVKDLVTAEPNTIEWDIQNFSYAIWAQGIDVIGWLLGGVITIVVGKKLTDKMNEKMDTKWVKMLMGGCLISLFTYLLASQTYGKSNAYIAAAAFGGITMFVLNILFKKNKRMQELSLGISILVGAALAGIIF